MNNDTSNWIRVNTCHSPLWVDRTELEKAQRTGRKLIRCWKRKDSEAETLHIDNIRG